MSLTADDYLGELLGLLPPGPAWPTEEDTELRRFLAGWAEEFARLDARADDLIEEADPRTSIELLGEWESETGLPDGCVGPLDGPTARQNAVVGRLTALGGQSIAYFIALALTLGYVVTITESTVHTCMSDCTVPIQDGRWRFLWTVNSAATIAIHDFTCIDDCMTPLRTGGNALLECTFQRLKPAHTIVQFNYAP